MKKILIFTDLDGSLLNHYNYSWQDAAPALKFIDDHQIPLIFTSSKTASEQLKLKQRMGNPHPFICENGAIANIPTDYFIAVNDTKEFKTTYTPQFFATPYEKILQILAELREKYHYKFRGFHDLKVDELVALTNLSHEQAEDSKQRQASEPFLWKDTDEAFADFKKHLEEFDLIVTSGGRFYHVMSNVHKGQTVKWLTEQYIKHEPDVEWLTIGLGDSYNDKQMLEMVDYPVFIYNPGTSQPDLSGISNLTITKLPGPAGWNEAVLDLVSQTI